MTPRTTTSVFVAMNATDGNTDINFYEASYQREYCTVQATASPLRCALEKLSAGTRYRISGMACMADYECSHRKFGEGYTVPDGKKIYQESGVICFVIISFHFDYSTEGPCH